MVDTQSALNNPDGSVTIFTNYMDGTSSISHYRQNGVEETLYGVDGGAIGSVDASVSQSGKVSINISGQVGDVTIDNASITVAPNAQATIAGTGNNIVGGANSTLHLTVYDSTITTFAGSQLTSLGSNNQYVIGPNSIVQSNDDLSTLVTRVGTNINVQGNGNTVIPGPDGDVNVTGDGNQVLQAASSNVTITNGGVGTDIVGPDSLMPDVTVHITSDTGFDATVGTNDVVFIANGGSEGGSFDNTPFGPGPDPMDEGGGGGGGGDPDPDPLINGHSFFISGDLEIIAGNGDNSLQGGLGKNVIMAGGGNNTIDASGTDNTVVVGGGINRIGVGGASSSVSIGGGQSSVSDFSQNGFISGGAGNLVVDFGPGNHTIIGGTGAARSTWDVGNIPDTGIPFANFIRGNANFYADIQAPVSNLIIGGPNGNFIQGGLGDNTIYGGESADQLMGGTSHSVFGGRSVIYAGAGDDFVEGGIGGEAILYGDAGNDTMRGGSSRSTLYGGDGNDTLSASAGYDSVLYGEAGDDVLTVGISSGNVTLDGGAGNDTLVGASSRLLQTVIFGRGYDHDLFEGVTSTAVISMNADVLPGDLSFQTNSQGDLLLSINGTSDVLTVGGYFVEGTYTINFSDGTKLTKADVTSQTPGLVVTDTVGGQFLYGSTLADTLSGSGGNDTLVGWGGGDTYLVELGHGVTSIWDSPDGNNTLVFGAGITPDSITISRTAAGGMVLHYGTQGDEVHVLYFDPFDPIRSLGVQSIQFTDGTTWDTPTILSRTPGVVLSDSAGQAILQGSPLNDTLSGVGGNNSLYGGGGNDTYLFDRGYGHVTVFDQDLSGNELNTIRMATGIIPADVTFELSLAGDLVLSVGGTADQITLVNFRERSFQSYEVTFADGTVWDRAALIAQVASFPIVADPTGSAITGSELSETLIGLGGNDFLDGLGGDDVMAGGGGNDAYYVEDLGDQVIELPGQGRDLVRSAIDYTLPDNVEDLQLSYAEFSGPTPITGIGNAGNNDLRGNFQDNILQGGAGDDTLWGGYSDGSTGPGNDELSGGTGNDTYYVDSSTGNGVDTIHDTSLPGEGNRLQLGAGVRLSDLSFVQGPGSLFVGVGSAGDGVVLSDFDPTNTAGSTVVDIISFTGGIEQTRGGFDVLLADFLKPSIDGSASDDALVGTSSVDVIRAGAGDDVMTGGQGNDVLMGGGGQDTFVYNQGDGSDLIDDVAQMGESNRVIFGAGITSDMLRLEYAGTANQGLLTLHVGPGADMLNFIGFFPDDPAAPYPIEQVQFTEGTTMSWGQLFAQGVDIRGTTGDDGELFGTFADDHMMGFAGDESLSSGGGDDTLEGGVGDDFLIGSSGADTYIYNMGDGRDQIEDEPDQIIDQTGSAVFVNNKISFGQGITLTDIDLAVSDGSLFIEVGTDGAGMSLGGFVDAQLGIRTLEFIDGLSLSLPDLADALLFSDDARVITGGSGSSTVLGGNGNDLLTGGSGPSVLIGWNGNDVLVGGNGPARFYAGSGADLLRGSVNDDTYVFNRGDGIDTIVDVAQVSAGNHIQFGAGIVLGDLIFTQDHATNRLSIQVGNSGLDAIELENFSLTGGDGSVVVQTLVFADGSTVQLSDLLATPGQVVGTDASDILTGSSGNETLIGGAGNDRLAGGAGDDTYVFNVGDGVDSIADLATPGAGNTLQFGTGITPEALSLGVGSFLIRVGTNGDAIHLTTFNPNDVLGAHTIDLFRFADGSSLSYDQLIARGFDFSGTSGNDTLNGTNVSDRIVGLAGDDMLVGGQGADLLVGGTGDDTYSVDSAADVVVELGNEGVDRVLAAVSYSLGQNVENLTLAGASGINGTGNGLVNALIGNGGSNVLDGGIGADTMTGGAGNDTYVVEDVGDVVVENLNQGTDSVQSSLSHVLGANVENLTLTGTSAIDGTGNELDNVLVGNSGNNSLVGGVGNDRLHGRLGADTLVGGVGNDTYRFDVGDGIDTIQDAAVTGEGNRILFGVGITLSGLTLTQDQSARTLTIQVGSSGTDKLVLTNFDPLGVNGSLVVETLAFADGSSASLASLLGPSITIIGTEDADVLVGTVEHDGIDAGAGNDTVYAGAGDDLILAGAGDDVVAGEAGIDTIHGGSGVDYLYGGDGDDLINGDEDNDVLVGESGNDTLTGGAGNDVLNGGDGADQFNGGEGDDSLYIDAADTVIAGGAGYDQVIVTGIDAVTVNAAAAEVELVVGSNGDDVVTAIGSLNGVTFYGGDGNDQLTGGEGIDVLIGEAGNDTLVGGDGNDVLNGGLGDDVLSGEAGDDTFYAGAGNDQISGGNGDDAVVGEEGADTIAGGSGNDYLYGGDGDDVVTGDEGNDTLVGEGGNDLLMGGIGSDVLNGGTGIDQFDGGEGDDSIYIDAADTVIAGGAGYDQVIVTGADAVIFNAAAAEVELVVGSSGDDVLTAVGSLNGITFYGGDGNDQLTGGDGIDVLIGEAGNDTLVGGTGSDVLNGGAGDDILTGEAGDDAIYAGMGDDQIHGGDGIDSVSGEDGVDTIFGGNGADYLYGGDGNDVINGDDGNDTMVGEAGHDRLAGGAGSDVLVGGMGSDTYVFNTGDGADTISENDLTSGNADSLLFGNTITSLDLVLSRQANDLRLAIHGSSDQVVLENWYLGEAYQVEDVQAGNGQHLLNTQVDQLIQAMATFTTQTGLTWDQAIDQRPQDVEAVLAASWQ